MVKPQEKLAWSPGWIRDQVRRHGWRTLIVALVLGLVATGAYAGVSGFISGQISDSLNRLAGGDKSDETGGDLVHQDVPVDVRGAPLTATYFQSAACGVGHPGGWLMPDEKAARAWGWNGDPDVPFVGGRISFILQGASPTAVVLTSAKLVVDRRLPVQGVVLRRPDECGAEGVVRPFDIRLSGTDATMLAAAGAKVVHAGVSPPPGVELFDGPDGRYYNTPPVDFPYQITNAEAEQFELAVRSVDDCDCLWHVEIAWASAGRTGTFAIDNHGKPFRTTSAPILECDPRLQPVSCSYRKPH
ncbi:hypothetical protein HDA40_000825 [Hamadaea flava]|uniref:Uncharacterized protein n=1 Tax=Hamadaea flava TaxID=1742688 RepID=A0ABV8LS00_9ACTN|nr:hypothetical protein [Hamadaea flava]MCP2322318.1 hypothetical protein [Hamadaea flava]